MGHTCPVCNYKDLFEEAYDEDGVASDEICPCCGFQFGYDDYPDKISGQVKWREKWISKGTLWFSISRKAPEGWSAREQLLKCNWLDALDKKV